MIEETCTLWSSGRSTLAGPPDGLAPRGWCSLGFATTVLPRIMDLYTPEWITSVPRCHLLDPRILPTPMK